MNKIVEKLLAKEIINVAEMPASEVITLRKYLMKAFGIETDIRLGETKEGKLTAELFNTTE